MHPFDPGSRDGEGVRKAIVLLTDGEDTHCGSNNPACDDSALDFSRADACAAVRMAETEIFVIAAMSADYV